jgi:hypothetical protein
MLYPSRGTQAGLICDLGKPSFKGWQLNLPPNDFEVLFTIQSAVSPSQIDM